MNVILASASPRRKELIKKIPGLEVEIIPSSSEENAPFYNVGNYVCLLAKNKAADVFSKHGGVVVGADTVVFTDRVLGKPQNELDAKNMLKELSGKTHSVVTGVCVMKSGSVKCAFCETKVRFGCLSESFIDRYVASGSPSDKAGAYGIQDEMLKPYVDVDEGDRDNVIGLPVILLKNLLEEKY